MSTSQQVNTNNPALGTHWGEQALSGKTGSRLGNWELVQLVSTGDYSQVYQARPVGSHSERVPRYAVKILRTQSERDPQAVGRMLREAMAGHRIRHRHVVSILSAHVNEAPFYLVMPWLQGETLAERMRRGRLPTTVEALWYARQAAEGLAAIHKAGWMHSDVKPSNIFISPEGHVTLLDLGFARQKGEVGSAIDRPVLGTAAYMAPELLSSCFSTDIRSDLYSLGVTIYEMLSGRLPFQAMTLEELATMHRQSNPASLRVLVPHVDAAIAHLVHRLLAKEPLRRPQDPIDLVEELIRLEIANFAER